ncbi:hypothetical protein [Cognatilysobacter tabacisoli]|uniref:hypothetical protein n=1 Tax=Cognatilysobacter tabacisoli TaxID=2315424 RepID=UPI000E6B27FC|nr:hypothetical protein [Lysobacter tabacisoli]
MNAPRFPVRLLAALACACPQLAGAQEFAALVSPPRFEATARAGTTYRDVIEINNVTAQRAHFTVRTADWTLDAGGAPSFSDALAPGSCRPWVGIEAADIHVPGNGRVRYRFEVAVPADAPDGQCRFAIMIEGDPQPAPGNVALPVAGRIGVIVYVTVGDARPRLELLEQRVRTVDGRPLPVLRVRNGGNAHGRLLGLVDGVDARGRTAVFEPASLPILPGETREIVLTPRADDAQSAPPPIAWPLALKGRLEAGTERLPLDATLAP